MKIKPHKGGIKIWSFFFLYWLASAIIVFLSYKYIGLLPHECIMPILFVIIIILISMVVNEILRN